MRLAEMIYTEEEMQELREEIKKLKSDLAFKNTMLDNVKAEYESSQDVIKELKEENKALKITVDENNLLAKDYVKLEEENRLLKNEIAWLKDHTKYNGITKEEYIDGTMTATEAKLRLQQAEANQNYISKLEEENKNLKESLDIATKCSSKEEDGIIRLSEENNKLKLHIEAKDKAYTALLKDYEEIKEDRDKMKTEIEEWLNAFRNR